MRRSVNPWTVFVTLWLVVAVPVAVAVAVPVAPAAGTPATGATGATDTTNLGGPDRAAVPALPSTQTDFDSTEFDITVYENGSARWTFVYKKRLNQTEREEFETFAAQFNNQSNPDLFANFKRRAEDLTRQGSNVTGRQMEAKGFHKRAYVTNVGGQGIVRMSFLWTEFAAQQGDRTIVSDVFRGGLYIGPDQKLLFHPGPTLSFVAVDPEPDFRDAETYVNSTTVLWEGPRDFNPQRPKVVYLPESQAGTNGTRPTTGPTNPGLGMLPWLALALVVVLGLGGAVAYRSGALRGPGGDGEGGGSRGSGGSGGSGGAGALDTAGGAQGGAGGAAAGAPGPESAEPAVPDEELLSDEDRVVQLLEESGGRMKQVNIVDETGWSKSKVSMLLSEMEDDEQITKLRVGRENIISLKGEEPDAAGSPFERDGEG